MRKQATSHPPLQAVTAWEASEKSIWLTQAHAGIVKAGRTSTH